MCLQDRVDGRHQGNQIVHGLVALGRGEFRVLRLPLQFIEYDVAAFILPVKLEDVLEQWAQLLARGDALYVVRLNEQLDMTGQRQYRPGAGRQHRAGHIVRIGNLTISRRQSSSHHRLDAPEQFLMLDLVVGKTHQRFECELIVKYMGPTLVEHLGTDKALDQAKNVRIGSTLNLAEQACLVCAEEGQAVDMR
ncbi:hypothetical protein D3C81_1004740 [compost metagenome]